MKSEAQKINIIIDRPNNSPRFYQLNRKTLKYLFIGLPATTVLLLTLSYFFASYFNHLYLDIKENEPLLVRELNAKIQVMTKEKEELVKNETTLLEKIEKGTSFSAPGITQLVKPPIGMNNKTGHNICTIEEVELKNKTLYLKIANQMQDKLRGYFFLFHYQGNQINILPTGKFSNTYQLSYRDGDSFTISRFKPMEIKLDKILPEDSFYSLIFSKDGDLIYAKEIKLNGQ